MGERFIVLEKPPLYCHYGYELYTCPALDGCKGPIDTSLETRYHRIKCHSNAGALLTVVSIEPRAGEWLVGFSSALMEKTLYAKTSQGALHEVVYAADLDRAKERWVGRTVYSARGFLNVIDDAKGSGSIKVDLRAPLAVSEVRPGLTPLPAKPLWVVVETGDGRRGVIPVRFSWTNSPTSHRHEGNPWDDDLFETDPSLFCAADEATWEIINSHHVRAGMTREQVRMSWGLPKSRIRGAYKGSEHECWEYENQRLWFTATELVGIEDK